MNGEIVKDKEGLKKGIFPGKPIKRDTLPEVPKQALPLKGPDAETTK